jgi:glycerol kinase
MPVERGLATMAPAGGTIRSRGTAHFKLRRRIAATDADAAPVYPVNAPPPQESLSMSCILALDQGTTSSRALVFDHAGTVRAIAQQEFRQIFPHPGWVEHDATEIWATQSGVLHEALAKAGVGARDVAAIGITNQRETTVLWERATGRPLANAIVWQDRRTAPLCDELRAAGLAGLFASRTGLIIDAYFSGTKLKWLLDHIPGARARAANGELAFGTIDSWLVWNLSGGRAHVTDASNASRTLLFDIHTGDWDDELLRLLDIPREVLPRVVPSSGVCAEATIGAVGIPIAGIAGDQQAALFGQACHAPGLAKNTYGTGCFLLLNTGKKAVASTNNLLTTVGWERDGLRDYALEGSVFIGGAVVQWLRDGLGIIRSAADIEALAASVPDNGGVYLVPAFAGLGAPHWDAYARGSMFGLTRGATAGHIARAALEAIAFQSADVLAAMERDAGITLAELRVDGGATANNLLMQFQADILGVPVVRPKVLETTALGAGYLAGLAVGYWKDASDVHANWQVDRRFEPAMARDRVDELRASWHKAVGRARDWA